MTVIPALIWIVIVALRLGWVLAHEGKQGEDYSFGWALFFTIAMAALLAWGGFFTPLFHK